MQSDTVSELELDAYVDGELDLGRRLAVETHLLSHPEDAVRVIADLRTRTALQLMQPRLDPPPGRLLAASRQLEAGLAAIPSTTRWQGWRRPLAGLTGLAAALAIAVLPAPKLQAGPPRYIADAMMAYNTNLLRVAMTSQQESRSFDPGDVRRFTSIRVPTLPAGWRIRDAQIFPSDEGPALQLLVETDKGRTVSVFAVRSTEEAPVRPITIRRGDRSVAYWRHGPVAYALIGVGSPDALDLVAEDLADNRLG